MVAGYFEGGAHADIYAVQNSYAPIPQVGRFDGGLSQLLRGDGHGHFTPVPPAESGLVVPGDAKALAVLDLDQDGWPGFLVTRNNGSIACVPQPGRGRAAVRCASSSAAPLETRRPWARASRSNWPTDPPRRPRFTRARATTASRPRHASSDTRRRPRQDGSPFAGRRAGRRSRASRRGRPSSFLRPRSPEPLPMRPPAASLDAKRSLTTPWRVCPIGLMTLAAADDCGRVSVWASLRRAARERGACGACRGDAPAPAPTTRRAHHEQAPRPEPLPARQDHVRRASRRADRRRDREPLRRPEDAEGALPGIRDLVRSARGSRSATTTATAGPISLSSARPRAAGSSATSADYKFEDVTEKAGVGAEPRRLEPGRDLRRHQQQRPARHLRLPHQRAEPPLHQPGRRDLQGDGPRLRTRRRRLERHGGLLRLRPRRLARRLHRHQHPESQRRTRTASGATSSTTTATAPSRTSPTRAGIGGASQSHSATWWDYDNDGWPDLYVANDYGFPDKLYHNNRDGTFTDVIDRVVPHTSFSSMGSDLGDVNNDGLIDFLSADMAVTTHAKDQHAMATRALKVGGPKEPGHGAQVQPQRAPLEHGHPARCSRPPSSRGSPPPTGRGRPFLRTSTTTAGSTFSSPTDSRATRAWTRSAG